MTTRVRELPYGRPLTVADLENYFDGGEPTDGHRYELIDGVLIVSPAPIPRHQRVVTRLVLALAPACSDELELLTAPIDVVLDHTTVVQPDLVIAPRADFTEKNLPTAPLLAIEVLCPSTREIDLGIKKNRLARFGCPHFWVVDPANTSATAWTLDDDRYVETLTAVGDEDFSVAEPVEVSFTPASLLD